MRRDPAWQAMPSMYGGIEEEISWERRRLLDKHNQKQDGSLWLHALMTKHEEVRRVVQTLAELLLPSHEFFCAAVKTAAYLVGSAGREPREQAWSKVGIVLLAPLELIPVKVRQGNLALQQRMGEEGFRLLIACGYSKKVDRHSGEVKN